MQRSAAAEEGDSPRPDDMNDEGLGQERFNKPPGLKQAGEPFLLLRSNAGIGKGAAIEEEPHQSKGGVVENC